MELRPGCKRSEIGVIPEDWKVLRLADIGRWFSGGTPSMANPAYWNGDIPWVSPKDMKVSRLHGAMDHVAEKAVGNGTRLLPHGALLIVVRGMILAHSFPVARAECALAFNQDLKAVVTRNDIDSNFVLHWLLSHEQQLRSLATESTHGTKRIPTESLFRAECAVPPLPEQRAIAETLGDVDTLADALTRLIAKNRDFKQAAMQQLLTGRTRLPGFSGKWDVKPIGRFSAFVTKGATPTTYGFSWENSGVLFLRSECISENGLDLAQSMFISEAAHAALIRGEVGSGDILITITGNVGRVIHLKSDFGIANINQHIARIRVKDPAVVPDFVCHWLSQPSVRAYYTSVTTGQAYPQISLRQVRETQVPLPSLSEQTAIASAISDMDAELAALEQRLAKTRTLKQGMMQELLTGRTRLV
jgi:type I restriction enzyme S subunit